MRTLSEIYPDWITNGFFDKIPNAPWDSTINATLDMQYFGNKSGTKAASPLLNQLCGDGTVTSDIAYQLAKLAANLYGRNWTALYNTMLLEYAPIENYDMEETEEILDNGEDNTRMTSTVDDSVTSTKTGTDTTTNSGTVERSDTGTVTTNLSKDSTTTTDTTLSRDGTDTTGVFGFNSTAAVNSDTTNSNSTDTTDESVVIQSDDTNTETRDLDNVETVNTQNETAYNTTDKVVTAGNKVDTTEQTTNKTITRTLRRHGNIGVTTSQQMIESERELWFWNFYDTVFSDLDKVLTSPIFILEV